MLERASGWRLFGGVDVAGHVAILALTALLVLNPPGNQASPSGSITSEAALPDLHPRLFAAHTALFVTFFAVTGLVFGRVEAPPGHPAFWFFVWGLAGVASTAVLWIALHGPPKVRVRPLLGALLVGGVLATVARTAGHWSQDLWHPFSRATLAAVTACLRALFENVEADPTELHIALEDFAVVIDPGCSGLEGVGLISVLLVAYLFAFRKDLRLPRAVLLLPLGAVAVWVGNVVRLVALIAIGAFVDPELADGGFHSKAGWVLFCAVSLGVAAIGHRSTFFSRRTTLRSRAGDEHAGPVSSESGVAETNPTAAYLMPLLALMATALMTSAFAKTFDTWYSLRIAAAIAALLLYRKYYEDIPRQTSLLAVITGLVVAGGWFVLTPEEPASEAARAMKDTASFSWIATRIVGSIAVVPLCEELAFRGYLQRFVISRDFTEVSPNSWSPLSLAVASLTFGVLHERWVAGSVAGLAYGCLQARTGRIADAVVAHATTNAVIAGYTLATGDFSHWG